MLIGLPTMVVVALALILMKWPIGGPVTMQLLAKQIGFRIDAEAPQQVSESINVRSVVLRGFDRLTVPANSVRIADPTLYDLRHDTYPDSAWTTVLGATTIVIKPKPGKLARVTIEPWSPESTAMALDRLYAALTTVIIARPEKAYVSVQLSGGQQQATLRASPETRLVVDDGMAAELPALSATSSVTLRVLAATGTPFIQSVSSSALTIGLELAADGAPPSLSKNYRMSHVKLVEDDLTGEPTSTIIGDGKITFDDHPGLPPVTLGADHFLTLAPADSFYNNGIVLTDDGRGFSVTLRGAVTSLSTGPKGSITDRRPSVFSAWSNSSGLIALFAIIGWLVPTLVAARSFVLGLSKEER